MNDPDFSYRDEWKAEMFAALKESRAKARLLAMFVREEFGYSTFKKYYVNLAEEILAETEKEARDDAEG